MNNRRGITATFFPCYEYNGYALRLIKDLDGVMYRVDPESLKWIETDEVSIIPSIMINNIQNFDSIDKQSSIYGENQALKDEIKFLREQVAKLLEDRWI